MHVYVCADVPRGLSDSLGMMLYYFCHPPFQEGLSLNLELFQCPLLPSVLIPRLEIGLWGTEPLAMPSLSSCTRMLSNWSAPMSVPENKWSRWNFSLAGKKKKKKHFTKVTEEGVASMKSFKPRHWWIILNLRSLCRRIAFTHPLIDWWHHISLGNTSHENVTSFLVAWSITAVHSLCSNSRSDDLTLGYPLKYILLQDSFVPSVSS